MPAFPINVVRFQNKVRGMFGLRGENPVPTLADLLPVVIIENDRPEFSYAGLEVLAGGDIAQQAPGVGNFAIQGVRNPDNSGVVVIIEEFWYNQNAAGQVLGRVSIGANRFAGVTELTASHRDTRWNIDPQGAIVSRFPSARTFFINTAAADNGSTIMSFPCPSLTAPTDRPQRAVVILAPGTDFYCRPSAANTQAISAWTWRERALERGLPS